MPDPLDAEVRSLFRGRLDTVTLDRLGALRPATPDQVQSMSRALEQMLMPHIAMKRGGKIAFTPADLARTLRRTPPPEPAKTVLELFLLSFLFCHRRDLFNPDSDREIPEGPVPRYLLDATPPVAALFRAAVAYARGRDDAWDRYDDARRAFEATGLPPLHHYNGLIFARRTDTLRDLARSIPPTTPEDRTFKIHPGAFEADLPLCLVGVDRRYHNLYAPQLIRSAEGIANLHIHVANPGDTPLPRHPHVCYSTEHSPSATPSYYASMRFLRLPALLDHYRQPITVIDADSVFTRPLDPFLEMARGADLTVNINRRAPGQFFWRHYRAQIVHAPPNGPARDILTAFASLFHALYDPTRSCWWIDQAILAQAIQIVRQENPELHLGPAQHAKLSGIKQIKVDAKPQRQ